MWADDRTGALEVGGACADAGLGPVSVFADGPVDSSVPLVVVDLATRHLAGQAAAGRTIAALGRITAGAHALKIDSTLRGPWAASVLAAAGALDARAVVVAALPTAGRVCVGGVVYDEGRPVGEGAAGDDARDPVGSSRPADHLRAAGATAVAELDGAAALAVWLADFAGRVAVCDASTDGDLDALGATWAAVDGVVLASTAAGVAAAAGRRVTSPRSPPPAVALVPPVLVVCGSLHAAARRQIEVLARAGAFVVVVELGGNLDAAAAGLAAGRTVVLVTPTPATRPVTDDAARAMASAIAAAVAHLGTAPLGTLVVIGGDTAAAVLGDGPRRAGGMLAPGTPWSPAEGGGPLVVTRSGAFGGDGALADLLGARMGP